MERETEFALAYYERLRAMIKADLERGGVSTKVETAPRQVPKPKRVEVDEGDEDGYYWENF